MFEEQPTTRECVCVLVDIESWPNDETSVCVCVARSTSSTRKTL